MAFYYSNLHCRYAQQQHAIAAQLARFPRSQQPPTQVMQLTNQVELRGHKFPEWSVTPSDRGFSISGPPPVGLPLRQKAKGGAAALEGRLAGVEWGVLAALAA